MTVARQNWHYAAMNASTPADYTAIRERLLARRRDLEVRARRIEADLRRETDPLTPDLPDQAIQRGNDAVLQAIEKSAEIELQQLNAALKRLDEGRYGECEICGGAIDAQRLEAVPYAVRCRDCATER